MKTLFEVNELRRWHEAYDEKSADSITAILTVETPTLRHTLTVTDLEDGVWLNEIFDTCRGVRVTYDENRSTPYLLEVVGYEDRVFSFPISSFNVDTGDLPRR